VARRLSAPGFSARGAIETRDHIIPLDTFAHPRAAACESPSTRARSVAARSRQRPSHGAWRTRRIENRVKRARVENVARSFQENAWTITVLETPRARKRRGRARAPNPCAKQIFSDLRSLHPTDRMQLDGPRSDLIETHSLRDGDDANRFPSSTQTTQERASKKSLAASLQTDLLKGPSACLALWTKGGMPGERC
jgi:hypothetical protein